MAKRKPRFPMPISERAKQFSPFAAVTGLEKALERQERELSLIPKKELSEEDAEDLNEKLNLIQKGDRLAVTYFYQGEYITLTGALISSEPTSRLLCIGEEKIPFDDLYKIELIEE